MRTSIYLGTDIDNFKLKSENEEKMNKSPAMKDKESFNNFIMKGFIDINPNVKKKHEP
jgi:hypothetical protein